MDFKISFHDLWYGATNGAKNTWVPLPSQLNQKLNDGIVPERLGCIHFNHIELDGVMINFEICKGRFNINTFSSILANGEAHAVWNKKKRTPFPNTLGISVLRARNLRGSDATPDCVARVSLRERRYQTHTVLKSANPMWAKEYTAPLDDASTVRYGYGTRGTMYKYRCAFFGVGAVQHCLLSCLDACILNP